MRAAVLRTFGGPEALTVEDIDTPAPGPGQVLVRVRASSANPVDGLIRRGVAIPSLPLPAVIGSDVSGVVEQVGAGVTGIAEGDAVYYTSELATGGEAYARYHVADASIVAPKPGSLSFAEAAAIPLAGGTAWEAVVPARGAPRTDRAGPRRVRRRRFVRDAVRACRRCDRPGHRGPDHQQIVRDLGATAIDYKNEDFIEVARDRTGGAGVDARVDTVGGENVARSSQATRDGGRISTVLAPEGRLDDLLPAQSDALRNLPHP